MSGATTSAMMMNRRAVNAKYRPLTHQRGMYAQEKLVGEKHSSVNEAARQVANASMEDRSALFGFHIGINVPIEDVDNLPAFDEKDDISDDEHKAESDQEDDEVEEEKKKGRKRRHGSDDDDDSGLDDSVQVDEDMSSFEDDERERKKLERAANERAQETMSNLLNPSKPGTSQGPKRSLFEVLRHKITEDNYSRRIRNSNLFMLFVAVIQCILVLLMLQIPFDDVNYKYDNGNKTIRVIEIAQSVLTAILLICIYRYYRLIIEHEQVQFGLRRLPVTVCRTHHFPLMLVEMAICILHPVPYLDIRKLALLVFFRMYLVLRVYRDFSEVYTSRHEIQNHESFKSKIKFNTWLSVRTLFYRSPWQFTFWVTLVSLFFFSYCVYICERETVTAAVILRTYTLAGCTEICPTSGEIRLIGPGYDILQPCVFAEPVIRPRCEPIGHTGQFKSCIAFMAFTMTTVGLNDMYALTNWGRVFTMLAAIAGLCVAGLLVTALLSTISLNYSQKFAADFCSLKRLALQEQDLAARVIQKFFRDALASGRLRRMTIRMRALKARARGDAGTVIPEERHATVKQANAARGGCCSTSSSDSLELMVERFKRYRLTAAQSLGQEDGTQLKHILGMRTSAKETAAHIEDLLDNQSRMDQQVQRMVATLLTTVQALISRQAEIVRRSGTARNQDADTLPSAGAAAAGGSNNRGANTVLDNEAGGVCYIYS